MINVGDEDGSSFSDEYENEYEEISNESSDEIDEANELDLGDSDDSDNSEDIDDITLKTTMIFPKKGQNKPQAILPMPQLKGIVLPKQKPIILLPKKVVKKYDEEEIELILQKMPGINILNNPIDYENKNMYDLLEKESQESIKDFSIRKEITLKISNIKDPKIKNSTCIVLGFLVMKKLRFGIKYDNDIEILVKDILAMLA
jgi:hypothetical protein